MGGSQRQQQQGSTTYEAFDPLSPEQSAFQQQAFNLFGNIFRNPSLFASSLGVGNPFSQPEHGVLGQVQNLLGAQGLFGGAPQAVGATPASSFLLQTDRGSQLVGNPFIGNFQQPQQQLGRTLTAQPEFDALAGYQRQTLDEGFADTDIGDVQRRFLGGESAADIIGDFAGRETDQTLTALAGLLGQPGARADDPLFNQAGSLFRQNPELFDAWLRGEADPGRQVFRDPNNADQIVATLQDGQVVPTENAPRNLTDFIQGEEIVFGGGGTPSGQPPSAPGAQPGLGFQAPIGVDLRSNFNPLMLFGAQTAAATPFFSQLADRVQGNVAQTVASPLNTAAALAQGSAADALGAQYSNFLGQQLGRAGQLGLGVDELTARRQAIGAGLAQQVAQQQFGGGEGAAGRQTQLQGQTIANLPSALNALVGAGGAAGGAQRSFINPTMQALGLGAGLVPNFQQQYLPTSFQQNATASQKPGVVDFLNPAAYFAGQRWG